MQCFVELWEAWEVFGDPGKLLESWEALETSGMLWCGPGKSGELRRGLGGYGKLGKSWGESLGCSGRLSASVGYS